MKTKYICSFLGGLILSSMNAMTLTGGGKFSLLTQKGIFFFLLMVAIFTLVWRCIIYFIPALINEGKSTKSVMAYLFAWILIIGIMYILMYFGLL